MEEFPLRMELSFYFKYFQIFIELSPPNIKVTPYYKQLIS
jgi:hypothetical protein